MSVAFERNKQVECAMLIGGFLMKRNDREDPANALEEVMLSAMSSRSVSSERIAGEVCSWCLDVILSGSLGD